jgi:hypothetical protein
MTACKKAAPRRCFLCSRNISFQPSSRGSPSAQRHWLREVQLSLQASRTVSTGQGAPVTML